MKEKKPDRYREVMEKTNTLESELEIFKKIADSLVVPYDEKRKLYLQSADFEDYALIDMDPFGRIRRKRLVITLLRKRFIEAGVSSRRI